MMNVRETIAYVATVFIFVGCVNTQPKVELTQLETDKKALTVLNNAYREGEIQAHEYIRKARILNAHIYKAEGSLDSHKKNN